MKELPSLPYFKIISALQRQGFVVVRQRGSHIRLQRRTKEGTIKLTVPAHKPVKKTTLARILKVAKISVEDFKESL